MYKIFHFNLNFLFELQMDAYVVTKYDDTIFDFRSTSVSRVPIVVVLLLFVERTFEHDEAIYKESERRARPLCGEAAMEFNTGSRS